MKWFDSSKMSYGFITMDGKVVLFHVNNVRKGEDYAFKPGDEVTFILDEYDKGVIDVKFLPTLSVFPSTSDFPTGEVESHPRDESWETVDSENEEIDFSRPLDRQGFFHLSPSDRSYHTYVQSCKNLALIEELCGGRSQQQCNPP
ncbi:MAG: cold shock domain-containing protein [Gammaproteobacteria bacterium]|nr:cold shock domain-containing protein [Gammaproteobacteria bacterium]